MPNGNAFQSFGAAQVEVRILKKGQGKFYHPTRADDESSSNLRALKGKHQRFSIFITST